MLNETFLSAGLSELSFDQAQSIDGGSFWYDAAYLIGATAKVIWTFSKDAVEYQHSLPANLKK
jgi:hypothetical protein